MHPVGATLVVALVNKNLNYKGRHKTCPYIYIATHKPVDYIEIILYKKTFDKIIFLFKLQLVSIFLKFNFKINLKLGIIGRLGKAENTIF